MKPQSKGLKKTDRIILQNRKKIRLFPQFVTLIPISTHLQNASNYSKQGYNFSYLRRYASSGCFG